MVAIPAAAVAHNAGEPEKSKVTTTAKTQKCKVLLRSGSEQQVPLLGITRRVPEGREEPEAAGEALVAVDLAGSEEEDVEKTA